MLTIFLIVLFAWCTEAFQYTSNHLQVSRKNILRLQLEDPNKSSFQDWSSPLFPKVQLDTWWEQIGDSLLTVGSKGVQQSHINSASELLSQHNCIRIKLASDKLDPFAISKAFVENELLLEKAELLQRNKLLADIKRVLDDDVLPMKTQDAITSVHCETSMR
eukprot:gene2462-4781_t